MGSRLLRINQKGQKKMNINDLTPDEQAEYEYITDYLSQNTTLSFDSWGRIGHVLMDSYEGDQD